MLEDIGQNQGQFRGSFFQDTAGNVVRSGGFVRFDITKELLDAVAVHLDIANMRKVGSIWCRYIRGLLSKDGFELIVQDFCFRSAISKQFPLGFQRCNSNVFTSLGVDEFPKRVWCLLLGRLIFYDVVHIV